MSVAPCSFWPCMDSAFFKRSANVVALANPSARKTPAADVVGAHAMTVPPDEFIPRCTSWRVNVFPVPAIPRKAHTRSVNWSSV